MWIIEGQDFCLKKEKYKSANIQRKSEKKGIEERKCYLIINIDSAYFSDPER